MIFKFHKWYDTIPGPWRLLFMLAIVVPCLIMLESDVRTWKFVGLGLIAFFVFPRVCWILKGREKKKGQ